MRAGKLRGQIQILDYSESKNATYGNPDVTYTARDAIWARVEPLKGQEFLAARAEQERLTVRFVIRYDSTVIMQDRVRWDSTDYDIIQLINVDGRNRELRIMAQEVIGA